MRKAFHSQKPDKVPGIGVLSRHPNPYPLLPPTYIIRWEEVVPPLGFRRVGAGMSSAFWLTPPHTGTPNALLAQEGVLHVLPGRYREIPIGSGVPPSGTGVVPFWDGWVSLLEGTGFPSGTFDFPCINVQDARCPSLWSGRAANRGGRIGKVNGQFGKVNGQIRKVNGRFAKVNGRKKVVSG
jgi:hypothetical protein